MIDYYFKDVPKEMLIAREQEDRKFALENIWKNLDVYDINNYGAKNHKILTALYHERVINDPAIEQAISRNLKDHSRKEFRYLTDQHNFLLDHHFMGKEIQNKYPTYAYLIHGIDYPKTH